MDKLRRDIDGNCEFANDQDLLAAVKEAYLRTAKIASRGVGMGSNKNYASAAHAYYEAYGLWPGKNKQWLYGFVEGFECVNRRRPGDFEFEENNWRPNAITGPTSAHPDYLEGFESGEFVADQIFHHWPESPDIHSKPKK